MMALAIAAPLATISACHKKQPPVVVPPPPPPPPPVQAAPAPPPPPPPRQQPPPPPPPAPPTEEELFARLSLADLIAQQPLTDAFFAYDKAELSDLARTSLEKDAAYLKKWTSVRITVEGHADSRGTNEYNLALGERRANVARDYLGSLGVDLARVAMVSKGEEQPFCTEEVESCFALNRRAHVVITAK
jgi:peptidoglycan-associated lipoprotein